MKKLFLTFILLSIFTMGLTAQQNVGFRPSSMTSPVINSDNSVTFRIEAPKAGEVQVKGDWEANKGEGRLTKTKMESGAIRHLSCPPKCTLIVLLSTV